MLEWIGIFGGLGLSIVGWIYTIGKKDEQLNAVRLNQDKQDLEISRLRTALFAETGKLDMAIAQHEANDHRHFQDTEVHWTSRERDELAGTLKSLKDGQNSMQQGMSSMQAGISALLERSTRRRQSD